MFYGVILTLHAAVPASTFALQQPSVLYDLKCCNSCAESDLRGKSGILSYTEGLGRIH